MGLTARVGSLETLAGCAVPWAPSPGRPRKYPGWVPGWGRGTELCGAARRHQKVSRASSLHLPQQIQQRRRVGQQTE